MRLGWKSQTIQIDTKYAAWLEIADYTDRYEICGIVGNHTLYTDRNEICGLVGNHRLYTDRHEI
jgi:hypothetical protein